MSARLLYRAFGVRSYSLVKTSFEDAAAHFHLRKKRSHQRCVACGSREVIHDGHREVVVRSLPIGRRPVWLHLHLATLCCRACGARRQESRDIADPRKSFTRALARYVVGLCEQMTMSAVAMWLGMSWGTVKSILQEHLERKVARRSWREVRRIAIDEIAVRKGHHYMTVVVDLDSGVVLYAAEGREHSVLQPVFQRLHHAHARLEAIAMDMSTSYLKAVRLYAPADVDIVHDPYHIVAAMNAVIDKVRRSEQRTLEAEGRKVLKGRRFLLLKAAERLEPERQGHLDELLAANENLAKTYLLKEMLRGFWSQPSEADAIHYIDQWIEEAIELGLPALTSFANTVAARFHGILAYYKHRITSGPLEGLNNKIKVLKRNAYGFNDPKFFALRILCLHDAQFRLSAA